MEIPHPKYHNHYGGQLQFDAAGRLYMGIGDGGGGGDPDGNAQNRAPLLGKILRIDPRQSGGAPYTVPADNPFIGSASAARCGPTDCATRSGSASTARPATC